MSNAELPEKPNLLPCPHCGSPAKFEDGGFNTIRVSCTVFECTQRQRVHKADRNVYGKLAAHWNTRSTTLPAQIED